MKRHLPILLLLTVVTAVVFGRVGSFEFLNFDDPYYVSQNPVVSQGLTAEGVKWVFSNSHYGNWHPLTGVTHLIDCELFGLNPAGHHIVNAVLHVINTLLMYWVMFVMTRRLGCSAFVAALFALHPLHVESVAWISERKDVLSGLFALLTLGAYAWYARRGGFARYALVFIALGLGLLSKPMLVTWPFLLLLLDYWPLRRIRAFQPESAAGDDASAEPDPPRSIGYLILEKLPLFALTLACSITTIAMQRQWGAMLGADVLTIPHRLANAVMSYALYVGKTIWPVDLAAIYPHPYLLGGEHLQWSGQAIFGTAMFLAIVTILLLLEIRRRAYLIVGWLWFVGTLVPVIGFVQAGPQAMADRFTYLPLTGLFIMLTWAVADWLAADASRRSWRPAVAVAGVLVIVICAALSWRQVGVWRNSETLFTHAVRISPTSGLAQNNLADALRSRGDLHRLAGQTEAANAAYDRAIEHFRNAKQIVPGRIGYRSSLAETLAARGQLDAALAETLEAMKVLDDKKLESDRPYIPKLYHNVSVVLMKQGRTEEAMKYAAIVLELHPTHRDAAFNRATMKAGRGDLDEAEELLQWLVLSHPQDGPAHERLAQVLAERGNHQDAITAARRAVELMPRNADARIVLGQSLARVNRIDEAVEVYEEAASLAPDNPIPPTRAAWLLATRPDGTAPHAARALALAKVGCALTRFNDAQGLKSLAAAYAAMGQFKEATDAATRAAALAQQRNQPTLLRQLKTQLDHYRRNIPYRVPRQPSAPASD